MKLGFCLRRCLASASKLCALYTIKSLFLYFYSVFIFPKPQTLNPKPQNPIFPQGSQQQRNLQTLVLCCFNIREFKILMSNFLETRLLEENFLDRKRTRAKLYFGERALGLKPCASFRSKRRSQRTTDLARVWRGHFYSLQICGTEEIFAKKFPARRKFMWPPRYKKNTGSRAPRKLFY